MYIHRSKPSMVLFSVRMAHTRGGTAKAVAPPQVYTTPAGIKVWKLNRKLIFQPASLKVSSYLALDKYYDRQGCPRCKLYENVQKFLDLVIDQVDDHILGIDSTGITIDFGVETHKLKY